MLILFLARQIWKNYYTTVDAIVFLVDSMDRERFVEAKKELDVNFFINFFYYLSLQYHIFAGNFFSRTNSLSITHTRAPLPLMMSND